VFQPSGCATRVNGHAYVSRRVAFSSFRTLKKFALAPRKDAYMRWQRIHGGRGRFFGRPQTLSESVTPGIRRALMPGVVVITGRTHALS
jgi:hypothetical protein